MGGSDRVRRRRSGVLFGCPCTGLRLQSRRSRRDRRSFDIMVANGESATSPAPACGCTVGRDQHRAARDRCGEGAAPVPKVSFAVLAVDLTHLRLMVGLAACWLHDAVGRRVVCGLPGTVGFLSVCWRAAT